MDEPSEIHVAIEQQPTLEEESSAISQVDEVQAVVHEPDEQAATA